MKFSEIIKDVFITNAYAMARTIEEDPLQSFMFTVKMGGTELGFQKVGGLSREVAVVEYLESMYNHKHKLPGREEVGEITFEKGMYAKNELTNMFLKTIKGTDTRFDIVVSIKNRKGVEKRKFSLYECWCSKIEYGDLDATSDDVLIETLTVQCEYIL